MMCKHSGHRHGLQVLLGANLLSQHVSGSDSGFQIRSRTLLPPPAGCAPTPEHLAVTLDRKTGDRPCPSPSVTYHSSRPLLGTFSMKLHSGRTHSRT